MAKPTFTLGPLRLVVDARGTALETDDGTVVALGMTRGDATLFGAAPDLYAALTDAVDDGHHAPGCPPGPCYCWRAEALAALAKAEGR